MESPGDGSRHSAGSQRRGNGCVSAGGCGAVTGWRCTGAIHRGDAEARRKTRSFWTGWLRRYPCCIAAEAEVVLAKREAWLESAESDFSSPGAKDTPRRFRVSAVNRIAQYVARPPLAS